MSNNDTKRLSRLTAILTQLQTKRLLTATELAVRFSISKRSIYRDIKALEQSGVPIITIEGKGYSLMDGYRIPPVMFSESEANALITAEHLVQNNTDLSFVKSYQDAIQKIKSVLRNNTKEKANLLSSRIVARTQEDFNSSSNNLSIVQLALTNFNLMTIRYYSPGNDELTERAIEPFALYTTQGNWLLVAFCRLRQDYRSFRLDRIQNLVIQSQTFDPHEMTLEEYFEICRKKCSIPLT